jgi:hypothetical protein
LNLQSSDAAKGTANIIQPNTCANGNTAIIEATPAAGCSFVQWSDGNTQNPRTMTVTSDMNLTGVFETMSAPATAADISVAGVTEICYGAKTTLTASATGVTNPVYKWYKSQTETAPFHIGPTYTTSNLTADSIFYVGVSGDNYSENATGDRREVSVILLDPNTQGKDFYVSFGQNYDRALASVTMQVRIVAQKTTTVEFTYKNSPALNTSFTVFAGSVYTHNLTAYEKAAVYSNTTGTSDKSLRIQSTEPISVYALNQSFQTTDATFVLPVDVLGSDYYHLSYMPVFTASEPNISDGYTIVAVEDNTEIYADGVSVAVLQSGDVYSYYEVADMTGRHITSSQPVAYFVTNQLTTVPNGVGARDHLYEQMTPVNVWGKTFVVPVTVRGIERVRIVASQDGTVITQSGGVIQPVAGGQTSLNLNRGQFVELEIRLATGGCYISSNNPVGVASYLMGNQYSGLSLNIGDPSLTVVPPIEQMIFSADVAPFIPTGSTDLIEHYVMVITPAATRDQTTVAAGSGAQTPLSGGSWTDGNGTGAAYSFYTMPLTSATDAYHFASPNGLLVMGFGVGGIESYCYLSGAAVRTLEASFSVDDNHYRDLEGQSICVGSSVVFRASGINPENGATGYLKWYIDGTEETAQRDVLQWTGALPNGSHTVRIDVVEKCRNYSFETTFTVTNRATAAGITSKDTTVCYGSATELTVNSGVPDPTFRWYKSQTETTPFHTGATYVTSALKADTVVYVSVAGTGYCENAIDDRKAIAVTIKPVCAHDDYVSTVSTTPARIGVLANDTVAGGCTPTLSILTPTTTHGGSAVIVNNGVLYIAAAGFFGFDTVTYSIACNGNPSTAKVIVLVSNSLSQKYVACSGVSVTMGFNAISGVTYHWFEAPTAGSPISSGNTLSRTKDAAPVQTLWVEARHNSTVFPRYRVDLELSDNCGTTNPQGCAATGRILWKEDFDRYDNGLNPGSPVFSSEQLAPGMTTYKFTTTDAGTVSLYEAGYYGLIKHGANNWISMYFTDDHTSPANSSVGRFFMANGATSADKLYQQTITQLCPGMELYFSFWTKGCDALLKWTVYSAKDNSVLATFSPTALSGGCVANNIWKLYGFKFFIPENVESVYFDVYNYATSYGGNDFAIDDIEVRLCAPPVTTNITGNDTIVCAGNSLDIIGTYIEDCTFGDRLAYRWEFRHADSINWKTLESGIEPVVCNTSPTIHKQISIASATKADEGYYRMLVSSPANIGSVNCRSASDSVYVHVVGKYVAPDLRIQVCPSPPNHTVQLSKYLDSTDYDRILWSQVSQYPVITDPATGLIRDANFYRSSTYTYKYTLLSPEYSGCGSSVAKVYMRVLNDHFFGRTVDTIVICLSLASSHSVNLNQISGLELGGVWSYPNDPDNVVFDNIRTFPASSKYAGAVVFDARRAYAAADSNYNGSYKGVSGKAFDFVYTASSCVNVTKHIVLVVTL